MGIFSRLFESGRSTNEEASKAKIRIVPNPGKENDIPISRPGTSLVDILEEIDSSHIVDLSQLNEFRTISADRENQYKAYDEMKEDSVISAALELYTDDATQYNQDGKIIWAESEDTDIAKFANRLIEILDLDKNAWTHIYTLCLYGDLYLETYRDENLYSSEEEDVSNSKSGTVDVVKIKNGYKMQEYVEAYPNPAELFDLTLHGKTVGFVKIPQDLSSDDNHFTAHTTLENQEIHDPRKFVHISLNQDVTRFPEEISISTSSEDGQLKVKTYGISRGKSILHDVYKTYQELSMLEDSLLLNRVTRSSIIRLLQIEVGDMSKPKVNQVLKRIKSMMEQKNMTDKGTGQFNSMAAPGPIDNIIYTTTRNGKGTINMSNVGGDVDVKSISDIDHFRNKLFGGLKIPKQFLGQDIDGGLGNGTSLTKIDSRYARTIKRIQNAYIQGITTLINLYALDKDKEDYVNEFTIKMTSPATVEDSERDEQMSSKMSLISDFIDLMGEAYSDETKKEVFEYMISTYIGDSEITERLKKDKPEPEELPDEDSEFGSAEGGDIGGDDFESDVGFESPDDFDTGEGFEDTGTEEFGSTPEQEEDFGDFDEEF